MDTERVHLKTRRNQLIRLATLTDVVYAVGLVLVIQWLPMPSESHSGGVVWIGELFAEYAQNLIAAFIGLMFIIIYWIRSNTLLTALDRTDGVHTGLSIASVFFILFLLYIVRVSEEVAAPSRRAGESVAVALVGITAGLAWFRARRKGLVQAGISATVQEKLQVEAYAEPLAALLTVPLAYVGEATWNLGWLLYIPIAAVLKRRERKREAARAVLPGESGESAGPGSA